MSISTFSLNLKMPCLHCKLHCWKTQFHTMIHRTDQCCDKCDAMEREGSHAIYEEKYHDSSYEWGRACQHHDVLAGAEGATWDCHSGRVQLKAFFDFFNSVNDAGEWYNKDDPIRSANGPTCFGSGRMRRQRNWRSLLGTYGRYRYKTGIRLNRSLNALTTIRHWSQSICIRLHLYSLIRAWTWWCHRNLLTGVKHWRMGFEFSPISAFKHPGELQLATFTPYPGRWTGTWRRSRAADLWIFAQEDFIGAKSGLDPHSVLANIRRRVMETVSVLPFGKFSEKHKREMRIFTSQA